MRILVVKRDKIGDLLLTTPLLAHLRRTRPRDEIHLLANDYNAWVVRDNPSVDRLWVYSRVRTGRKVSVPAAFASGWQLVQLRRPAVELRARRCDELRRLGQPLREPPRRHDAMQPRQQIEQQLLRLTIAGCTTQHGDRRCQRALAIDVEHARLERE